MRSRGKNKRQMDCCSNVILVSMSKWIHRSACQTSCLNNWLKAPFQYQNIPEKTNIQRQNGSSTCYFLILLGFSWKRAVDLKIGCHREVNRVIRRVLKIMVSGAMLLSITHWYFCWHNIFPVTIMVFLALEILLV